MVKAKRNALVSSPVYLSESCSQYELKTMNMSNKHIDSASKKIWVSRLPSNRFQHGYWYKVGHLIFRKPNRNHRTFCVTHPENK